MNGDVNRTDGTGIILIAGLPRSGTTWIGKIFDSHRKTLYRHEPDSVLRDAAIPLVAPSEEIPRLEVATRHYVEKLITIRTPKVSGKTPVFNKEYYTPLQYYLRSFQVTPIRPMSDWVGLRPSRTSSTLPAGRMSSWCGSPSNRSAAWACWPGVFPGCASSSSCVTPAARSALCCAARRPGPCRRTARITTSSRCCWTARWPGPAGSAWKPCAPAGGAAGVALGPVQ